MRSNAFAEDKQHYNQAKDQRTAQLVDQRQGECGAELAAHTHRAPGSPVIAAVGAIAHARASRRGAAGLGVPARPPVGSAQRARAPLE